jgi:hypothetical protein
VLDHAITDLWGYKASDWLVALGYKLQGTKYVYQGGNGPDAGKFRSAVPAKFFASGSRTSADKDVLYEIYFNNFLLGCQAKEVGPMSSLGANDPRRSLIVTFDSNGNQNGGQADSDGWWYYKIWYIDDNGKAAQYLFKTDDGPDEDVAMGYGTGLPGETECDNIASKLASHKDWAEAWATSSGGGGKKPGGGGGSAGGDPAATCEGAIPVLGWVICAITEIADNLMTVAEKIIKDVMTLTPAEYGESGTGVNGLKTAWSAVRILSTVVLVAIALFMIISQIFNFDFVSAYTIKKVVPKLVIAIIAMQLSWFLATAMIEVFNILGAGIQELIYAPFGGAKKVDNISAVLSAFYAKNGGGAQVSGTLAMAAITGGVLAGIGGAFGLLAAAIGVVIAILIALVTLVLRKIILIVLLVLAPLAIVMWILPNTQKYWKMWSDLFIKLLIMFPIIMGMLAIGRVFAYLVAHIKAGSGGQFVNFFVILIAYFGTLFLIPKTFSMAGGIFAKVSGAISSAGGKAKVGVMKSKPMENLKKSDEYRSRRAGATNAASGNFLRRNYGRFQLGTFGAVGAYGEKMRSQERAAGLKDAEDEYNAATLGMGFPDKMTKSEEIAKAKIGSSVDLGNGKKVRVTEAMQDHAFSQLVGGKKGDSARSVIAHYEASGNTTRVEKFKNDNVGGLLSQAPDVYKGDGAFEDISVGSAAKMDNTAWEKMAARHAALAAAGATNPQDPHHAEYQAISHVANTAYNDSKYDEDMTGTKRQHAEQIIAATAGGPQAQGQPRQQAGTTRAQQTPPPPPNAGSGTNTNNPNNPNSSNTGGGTIHWNP